MLINLEYTLDKKLETIGFRPLSSLIFGQTNYYYEENILYTFTNDYLAVCFRPII
jgi:hypothetical protein